MYAKPLLHFGARLLQKGPRNLAALKILNGCPHVYPKQFDSLFAKFCARQMEMARWLISFKPTHARLFQHL